MAGRTARWTGWGANLAVPSDKLCMPRSFHGNVVTFLTQHAFRPIFYNINGMPTFPAELNYINNSIPREKWASRFTDPEPLPAAPEPALSLYMNATNLWGKGFWLLGGNAIKLHYHSWSITLQSALHYPRP